MPIGAGPQTAGLESQFTWAERSPATSWLIVCRGWESIDIDARRVLIMKNWEKEGRRRGSENENWVCVCVYVWSMKFLKRRVFFIVVGSYNYLLPFAGIIFTSAWYISWQSLSDSVIHRADFHSASALCLAPC